MTTTTKQLLKLHGLTDKDIENFITSERVIYFKEFQEGFISIVKDEDYDHLYSMAVNNRYSYSMWKDLIKYIDNRTRPILVVFGDNHDRLFRAAKRYDYEIISEDTILIK